MQAFTFFFTNANTSLWLFFIGTLYLAMTIAAAIHILLHKDQEGTAIAWLGVVLLSPLIGPLLYWLFGINRIMRRAKKEFSPTTTTGSETGPSSKAQSDISGHPAKWRQLMTSGLKIHQDIYLPGNLITPLINGDQAYPKMLDAIENAGKTILLSSYIFDYDSVGRQFVEALGRARSRGVMVRVMIDGVGVGYRVGLVKTDRKLKSEGIESKRFLPALSTRGTRFVNLRNHRKILSVDSKIAFVGGINIREGNLLEQAKQDSGTRDIHFCCEGPVIDQLNDLFRDDWLFASGEILDIPRYQQTPNPGRSICRVLPDGPDENYLKLEATISNAIHAAQHNISIVTPYLLPGAILIHALKMATLRGVQVEIIVPKRSNIRIIDWATRAVIPGLLQEGIHVYLSARPFDHSKLFLIDEDWALLGSSNWDSRSLKLNFEVNLECFDSRLNRALTDIVVAKKNTSQRVRLSDFERVSFIRTLRNNFFKLLSPYL